MLGKKSCKVSIVSKLMSLGKLDFKIMKDKVFQ